MRRRLARASHDGVPAAILAASFVAASRWLKPLWVRLRAARVEEKSVAFTGITNDYRAIVNYEKVFK